MAFVPGFQHDVFISYAHVDNIPRTPGEEGWVTKLHGALTRVLPRVMGRAEGLDVWMDPRLRGSDYFDDTIAAAVHGSALFIAVLSPGYIASTYCLKELQAFCTYEHPLFGLQVEVLEGVFKSRAQHVMIATVQSTRHPAELRGRDGLRFFATDPTSQRGEQFRQTREDDADQRYWTSLNDLAHDVGQVLQRMAQMVEQQGQAPQPAGPVVFLAEVTDDLEESRDQIKRALVQQGVTVLPQQRLPQDGPALERALGEALQRSVLAVHLVGSLWGKAPDGYTRSHAQIQYDVAAQVSLTMSLRRMVWMPRGLESAGVSDARQRSFIDALEREPDAPRRAEVLKVSLEDLREMILKKVLTSPAPSRAKKSTDQVKGFVYITCQPEDEPEVERPAAYLSHRQFGVIRPISYRDRKTVREDHEGNIEFTDALMIMYGNAPIEWVRAQLREAIKIIALQKRSYPVMAIYEGPPPGSKEELRFALPGLITVNCREGFQEERLQDFLTSIEARLQDTRG